MVKKEHAPTGTPALVALTAAGVTHTAHAYSHDPASTLGYGLEAAAALGVPPEQEQYVLVRQQARRLRIAANTPGSTMSGAVSFVGPMTTPLLPPDYLDLVSTVVLPEGRDGGGPCSLTHSEPDRSASSAASAVNTLRDPGTDFGTRLRPAGRSGMAARKRESPP